MIYFVIMAYIIALSFFYDFRHHTVGRKLHFFLLLIILICLAGFRYRLGLDTIRYEWFFSQVPTLSQLNSAEFQDSKYDPLYLLLASSAKSISPEFWVVQMFQSILVNSIFFRFFYKNSRYLFLSLLLYFFLLYVGYMTETMRESCSIAMLLVGWEFYKNNQYLKLFGCCVLAFLFHSSAIMLFIVFILIATHLDTYIRFSRGMMIIAAGILAIAPFVQDFFINNVGIIAFSSRIVDKIDLYTTGEMADKGLNVFGAIGNILLYVFIPYICILTLRGTKYAQKLEFFLVLEMFFAMVSVPVYIFYRYVGYFMPFVVIALTNALAERRLYVPMLGRLRTKNAISWAILLLPFIFNAIGVMTNNVRGSKYKNYSKYYPYSSIFTKELDSDRETVFSYYDL